MHIQRHSQLLRHRRERTTPAHPFGPLSRDREKGDGIETERCLFRCTDDRSEEERREKSESKRKRRNIENRERKGVCRGAHDFLHILRRLLSAVEDNQAATTSINDSG